MGAEMVNQDKLRQAESIISNGEINGLDEKYRKPLGDWLEKGVLKSRADLENRARLLLGELKSEMPNKKSSPTQGPNFWAIATATGAASKAGGVSSSAGDVNGYYSYGSSVVDTKQPYIYDGKGGKVSNPNYVGGGTVETGKEVFPEVSDALVRQKFVEGKASTEAYLKKVGLTISYVSNFFVSKGLLDASVNEYNKDFCKALLRYQAGKDLTVDGKLGENTDSMLRDGISSYFQNIDELSNKSISELIESYKKHEIQEPLFVNELKNRVFSNSWGIVANRGKIEFTSATGDYTDDLNAINTLGNNILERIVILQVLDETEGENIKEKVGNICKKGGISIEKLKGVDLSGIQGLSHKEKILLDNYRKKPNYVKSTFENDQSTVAMKNGDIPELGNNEEIRSTLKKAGYSDEQINKSLAEGKKAGDSVKDDGSVFSKYEKMSKMMLSNPVMMIIGIVGLFKLMFGTENKFWKGAGFGMVAALLGATGGGGMMKDMLGMMGVDTENLTGPENVSSDPSSKAKEAGVSAASTSSDEKTKWESSNNNLSYPVYAASQAQVKNDPVVLSKAPKLNDNFEAKYRFVSQNSILQGKPISEVETYVNTESANNLDNDLQLKDGKAIISGTNIEITKADLKLLLKSIINGYKADGNTNVDLTKATMKDVFEGRGVFGKLWESAVSGAETVMQSSIEFFKGEPYMASGLMFIISLFPLGRLLKWTLKGGAILYAGSEAYKNGNLEDFKSLVLSMWDKIKPEYDRWNEYLSNNPNERSKIEEVINNSGDYSEKVSKLEEVFGKTDEKTKELLKNFYSLQLSVYSSVLATPTEEDRTEWKTNLEQMKTNPPEGVSDDDKKMVFDLLEKLKNAPSTSTEANPQNSNVEGAMKEVENLQKKKKDLLAEKNEKEIKFKTTATITEKSGIQIRLDEIDEELGKIDKDLEEKSNVLVSAIGKSDLISSTEKMMSDLQSDIQQKGNSLHSVMVNIGDISAKVVKLNDYEKAISHSTKSEAGTIISSLVKVRKDLNDLILGKGIKSENEMLDILSRELVTGPAKSVINTDSIMSQIGAFITFNLNNPSTSYDVKFFQNRIKTAFINDVNEKARASQIKEENKETIIANLKTLGIDGETVGFSSEARKILFPVAPAAGEGAATPIGSMAAGNAETAPATVETLSDDTKLSDITELTELRITLNTELSKIWSPKDVEIFLQQYDNILSGTTYLQLKEVLKSVDTIQDENIKASYIAIGRKLGL